MIIEDDRSDEQLKTHTILIVMTDRFLSGWGRAGPGPSYAAWACRPVQGEIEAVTRWVESREDALRVRVVHGKYHPRGDGHCHVYVAHAGHPALSGYYN